MKQVRPAFTIVELLVVIGIITLLVGILLPAVGRARAQARFTASQSNLRNLGTAHANYASEWNDRQFTLAVDSIASYGLQDGCIPGPIGSAFCYANRENPPTSDLADWPPPIQLGWASRFLPDGQGGWEPGSYGLFSILFNADWTPRHALMAPIIFDAASPDAGFGWFRIPNARQFTQYLNGRFYDPVFYAPNDEVLSAYVEPGLESPEEYLPEGADGRNVFPRRDGCDEDPSARCLPIGWSSYCLSPAALFSPDVMRNRGDGGWQDPWSLGAGMRAPAMSQARYPELKTHMLEHHWNQDTKGSCNPALAAFGNYEGCEPYYFNHGWDSSPAGVFYDGHVESIGVRAAERADGRMNEQTGGAAGWGLWSRDTPFGPDGYFIDAAYDQANTSFHILTTDGIRGRDTVSGG